MTAPQCTGNAKMVFAIIFYIYISVSINPSLSYSGSSCGGNQHLFVCMRLSGVVSLNISLVVQGCAFHCLQGHREQIMLKMVWLKSRSLAGLSLLSELRDRKSANTHCGDYPVCSGKLEFLNGVMKPPHNGQSTKEREDDSGGRHQKIMPSLT